MRTGRRRHRGTFLSPPVTEDEYGAPGAYVTVVTRDISVEPIRGTEKYRGMQDLSTTTHRVNLRYDSALAGLAPNYRITFRGRTLEIEAVMNIDEVDREFELLCKEVH